MNFLGSIKYIAIALAIGLLTGGYGGWLIKAKFEVAKQVAVVVEARKEDSHAIDQAQQSDQVLAQKADSNETNSNQIKKEIKRYATPKAPVVSDRGQPDPVHIVVGEGIKIPPMVCDGGDTRLSFGELRLLNAARRGTGVDSAALPSDAEGQATSDVTRDTFIENDIEVTRLYHELADDHDALVEFVLELQRKQRASLSR